VIPHPSTSCPTGTSVWAPTGAVVQSDGGWGITYMAATGPITEYVASPTLALDTAEPATDGAS